MIFFTVLKCFVLTNISFFCSIQGAFWERIDTFVSNLKYLDEVAEFLIEVVTNNFLICSSVTENQLNSFFSVINKRGKKKLFIKLLQVKIQTFLFIIYKTEKFVVFPLGQN